MLHVCVWGGTVGELGCVDAHVCECVNVCTCLLVCGCLHVCMCSCVYSLAYIADCYPASILYADIIQLPAK